MIDTWFNEDLQSIFEEHSVAVFIDESGDAEFLLRNVKDEYAFHAAHSEVDELHVKYLIEREQPSPNKYLIYTHTPKDKLKFAREYCETNGCIEIPYLQNYIKDKVHQKLNLNINLPREELISAAKVSVGKDHTYWMDLSHKGATEIFDLKKELLPFIHDPETYSKEKYDSQLRETFYRKVNELLEQDYIEKPPQTLAVEVVKAVLDGLAHGECNPTLESVYSSWLDSISYRDSFPEYLDKYVLPSDMDVWSVHPNHPFRAVDEQWLKAIGDDIGVKESLPDYLAKISERDQSKQAHALGIAFWADVKTLLTFDPKDVAYLSSLTECVEFYTKHFYRLDTAIRNLYAEFLNRKELLEPFQEHYKQLLSVFLDQWFKHFNSYEENQTGILQRIIDETGDAKTAIIVSDGIAYEVACQISTKLNKSFDLAKDVVIADIPSETANNMSRIYMANGATEKVHANREKYLLEQNPDISIEFVKLDEVNEKSRPSQILIGTYKDVDDIGEKLQQKALKYFTDAIEYIASKISLLLNSGYSKVYLITDHGFVLTGLLSESDKISVSPDGTHEKAERYLRTKERQESLLNTFVEVEKKHLDFNYLYFSKNINPFKSPGVYGFSHGGISPQELVTPYFCWERTDSSAQSLAVVIGNKNDLASVAGDLFQLTITSDKSADDLFSMTRKVYLVFFSNKVQVNTSDVFAVQKGQSLTKEYAFEGNSEIEVHLLDAQTKGQLDKAIIKQNKDRDLGGLL